MKEACNQQEDVKAALVRLAGGDSSSSVKANLLKEFGSLRVNPLPPQLADACEALHERQVMDDGKVVLAGASERRNF